MRVFQLLAPAMMCIALNAFGDDCASVIQVKQQSREGKEQFIAKNISKRPIIAYVVTDDRGDAGGNPVHVFSGVFTGDDSFHPGASMEIGSSSSSKSQSKPLVDYVRLADGWSCGAASTKEAKAVITRLGKEH